MAGWTYVKRYISVVATTKDSSKERYQMFLSMALLWNIKYQQIHSNKPCRKFFNRKLIFTTRGWIRKQKNETTNLYLKKLAQYFGLKDKPSSVANRKKKIKLKVLYKWEFENSSWRRIVFQIENNNLLVLFFCLLLHRLLVRISLRLKNVLHGKSLWKIYFYTFFPRYLWEVKLKRAISMIQWFNDSFNYNFLHGNNVIYA